MRVVLLLMLAACGSSSRVLSAEQCAEVCRDKAGSDSAFCPGICSVSCAARCEDLELRMGLGHEQCNLFCSSTAQEMEQTFGLGSDVCEWIIENRPSAKYTPRELHKR